MFYNKETHDIYLFRIECYNFSTICLDETWMMVFNYLASLAIHSFLTFHCEIRLIYCSNVAHFIRIYRFAAKRIIFVCFKCFSFVCLEYIRFTLFRLLFKENLWVRYINNIITANKIFRGKKLLNQTSEYISLCSCNSSSQWNSHTVNCAADNRWRCDAVKTLRNFISLFVVIPEPRWCSLFFHTGKRTTMEIIEPYWHDVTTDSVMMSSNFTVNVQSI